MAVSEVYNIDCIEYMKTIPDKFFDLIIADPPYGISVNMNMGKKKGERARYVKKGWDNEIPTDGFFQECFRVSRNQIFWGGNYFPLPLTKSWIFWDKDTPKGVDFADGELAWTSFDKSLIKLFLPYSGFRGIDLEGRIHPTQKPVRLYKWILQNYAKPGDKILDTHLGSGSSRIAAWDMGFDFFGCELDKDYFDASVKRFENFKLQQKLF